jgi:hypothetical protein
MPEVELHPFADDEMKCAAAYYEEQRQDLGIEFLDEVQMGFAKIRQFPKLWSVYEDDYRRYLLKRFP